MRQLQARIVHLHQVRVALPVRQHLQDGEAVDGAERRRMHLHLAHWRRRRRVDGELRLPVNGGRMVVMRMARGILMSEGRQVQC
jgi:urease accessory protein UreE